MSPPSGLTPADILLERRRRSRFEVALLSTGSSRAGVGVGRRQKLERLTAGEAEGGGFGEVDHTTNTTVAQRGGVGTSAPSSSRRAAARGGGRGGDEAAPWWSLSLDVTLPWRR